MGVGGCGYPISFKVLRTGTAYFALIKSAPNSDLEADDMTDFTGCKIFSTTFFLSFGPVSKVPTLTHYGMVYFQNRA